MLLLLFSPTFRISFSLNPRTMLDSVPVHSWPAQQPLQTKTTIKRGQLIPLVEVIHLPIHTERQIYRVAELVFRSGIILLSKREFFRLT